MSLRAVLVDPTTGAGYYLADDQRTLVPVSFGGGGAGVPGGATTQVQFNDGGAFGGDAGLTYDKATDTLSVGTLDLTAPLAVVDGGTGTGTPSLVAGSGVSIAGSWPNQTVSAAAVSVSMGDMQARLQLTGVL